MVRILVFTRSRIQGTLRERGRGQWGISATGLAFMVVARSNTCSHRRFDCLFAPRQERQDVQVDEFLLLVDLVLISKPPCPSRQAHSVFRFVGAVVATCSSRSVRIAYQPLATTTTCLSPRGHIAYCLLATSSLPRDLVGTGNVSDSNIAHHGHRPSRFIWVTPTGVMATGPAIMVVMRLHGRLSGAS